VLEPAAVAEPAWLTPGVRGSVISVPAGRHGDRRGAVRVLAGGVACFALAYVGLAATDASLPILGACFVLAGLGIGCVETAEHAAVALLAPEPVRGSAFGVLAGVQSVGNLAAGAIAGVLYTALSPTAVFVYAAALMVAALVAPGFMARS
jgi:MFS family permease